MKLKYDPYQIFRSSKTPAGLYARQKWLGEAGTKQWKFDFDQTVAELAADQLPNGSWHLDTMATIQRLFGLHLTVRTTNAQIDAALTWLLDKIEFQNEAILVRDENVIYGTDLKGLPFVQSRPTMLVTGAALFLASIFGRQNDPTVLNYYRMLCTLGVKNKGRWIDGASSHNVFRALVVHPEFSRHPVATLAAERLAELQTDNGVWKEDLSFYQTVNALAHLDLPQADNQLKRAFDRLFRDQNKDGSWGRTEVEWNTFLSIHALKNKGLL
jgi:hypothetical protein